MDLVVGQEAKGREEEGGREGGRVKKLRRESEERMGGLEDGMEWERERITQGEDE